MVRSAPSDDGDGDGDGGDGGGSSVEYSNSNQFDLSLANDLADGRRSFVFSLFGTRHRIII